MHDITAFISGTSKELVEKAEKILKKKSETDEKDLKLSTTEGGKEGRNKAITSCKYLDERFHQCSKKGVPLETSAEAPGVDLRTRTKQLEAAGGEGEGEEEEVRCETPAHQEKSDVTEKLH